MEEFPPRRYGYSQTLFTQWNKNFTYVTISTAPNCRLLPFPSRMLLGMKTKLTDKLSTLQANDDFRDWHTLDDERVCELCCQKFTGHEVVISMKGDGAELHCPTPDCQSRVHQWVHPTSPHLSEKNLEAWWHALGSSGGLENTGSAPFPQPV